MLVGKFCCSGCSDILHCQELRICSRCDDILCSLCQFSKCYGATERDVFHKTKKLESLIRKVSLTTEGHDEFGELYLVQCTYTASIWLLMEFLW